MRLSGSPVPHAGRVEIRFNGVWGTISSSLKHSRIYPEITSVICRQLNFTDGILATAWLVFGPGTGPQWFESRDLHCLGNETNLLNCSYPEPHLTRNKDYSDVSVVCKPDLPQTSGKFTSKSNVLTKKATMYGSYILSHLDVCSYFTRFIGKKMLRLQNPKMLHTLINVR